MKRRAGMVLWTVFLLALIAVSGAATAAPAIGDGSKVTVHYIMKSGGEVLDDSHQREPVSFVIGESQMMPSFQENIRGLKTGDKKNFTLEPDQAFGMPNPEAVVSVPRDKLPPGELEAGMMFSTTNEQGMPLRATVVKIDGDQVSMDFNHPLAGKTLDFEVEVISVE